MGSSASNSSTKEIEQEQSHTMEVAFNGLIRKNILQS